jgi:trehalose 6-phosphate phosphatase
VRLPPPVPSTPAGIEGLRALLARPAQALVGLDFDGTLSPIVANPALARPAPGGSDAVRRLARHVGALAIVTGRPARTAIDLLGFADPPPNLVVLGHYGLERWTSGRGVVRPARIDQAAARAAVSVVRAELPVLLAAVGAPAGTVIEDKGESLAVHVRRTADPDAALALLRAPLSKLARAHGLRLEPGRLVLELRPAGVDKGLALESLARETGAGVVCYAGDDLGDVAAFDALDRLRTRGVATLAICSGSDEVPELRGRADLIVDGPVGLVGLVNAICDAIEVSG